MLAISKSEIYECKECRVFVTQPVWNPRSWCAGSLLSRTKYDLIIAVHVQRVKPSDFWKLNYVEQFLHCYSIFS